MADNRSQKDVLLAGGVSAWVLWAPVVLGQDAGAPISVVGDDAAQTTTSEGQPLGSEGGEGAAPGGGMGMWMFLPLIGLMIFMLWSSSSQQKKQRKQHEELISSLTKHDKVLMSGGIIGTIQEMHGDELVLKVDESTGTRVRFSASAVSKVLSPSHLRGKDAGDQGEDKTNEEPAAA